MVSCSRQRGSKNSLWRRHAALGDRPASIVSLDDPWPGDFGWRTREWVGWGIVEGQYLVYVCHCESLGGRGDIFMY